MTHDFLVFTAKSAGLIYMMGFFLIAVVYALWPGLKPRFDRAAQSVLEGEDGPCR